MPEWDGNENSCSCDCGFDIPKGGTLDTLTVKDIRGIANLIYPVGSIYMSLNQADPSTLFGGTWERIQDKFLLAAGGTYSAGSEGGNAAHKHISPVGYNADNKAVGISYAQGQTNVTVNGAMAATGDTASVGSAAYTWTLPSTSQESNVPPYLAVYVWKRTA